MPGYQVLYQTPSGYNKHLLVWFPSGASFTHRLYMRHRDLSGTLSEGNRNKTIQTCNVFNQNPGVCPVAENPDVLRPDIVGVRGSKALRTTAMHKTMSTPTHRPVSSRLPPPAPSDSAATAAAANSPHPSTRPLPGCR